MSVNHLWSILNLENLALGIDVVVVKEVDE
jgi:hypothetical protein